MRVAGSARRGLGMPIAALFASAVLVAIVAVTPARAAGSWWSLGSSAAPTNLAPGGEGQILVSATNRGYADAQASAAHPLKLVDRLPAGLEVGSEGARAVFLGLPVTCPQQTGQLVECELPQTVSAAEGLELKIAVKATAPSGTTLSNEVTIEGGEGQATTPPVRAPLSVDSATTGFGVERYDLTPEREDGSTDVQAGSHPFQLTTTFNLNKALEFNSNFKHLEATAPLLPRDLHFVLPPGLLGNITVVPQCSGVDFATIGQQDINLCPSNTAVGTARVTINEPNVFGGVITEAIPVFNLAPEKGEPARFGLEIDKVPVVFNTAVRTGGDYAVEVSVENASQAAALLSTEVTFWGVPGDARHDASRGWTCIGHGHFLAGAVPAQPCEPLGEAHPQAFLTLPTSCSSTPTTTVTGDSWPTGSNRAVSRLAASYQFPSALQSCDLLGFAPAITVEPETHAANEPSGLNVEVTMPQGSTVSATELAESDAREATVALPPGVLASPGAANGLQACFATAVGLEAGLSEPSQLENDHFSASGAACPDGSKIGTAVIETPLLANPLTGFVYLAEQDTNLMEEKLVLYLIAEDPSSGVRVKLAGEVHVDPQTGQLTSTFKNTPP
jgi:hypothetical protein